MKKLILFLLILWAAHAHAQQYGGIQYVNSAPVGACSYAAPMEIVMLTGIPYTCANGQWAAQAGGSAGVEYVNAAPSGSCSATPPIQIVSATGIGYLCNNGAWGPLGNPVPGATLPTNAIVYGLSPNTSRAAVASDIATTLGYTPLGPSAIPNTTAILKGSGTYGSSVAATGSDVNALVSGLSGCGTNGNVYSPAGSDCIAAGGAPGGSNTQIQFNNGGSFAGNPALTFNPSTAAFTVGPTSMTLGSPSGQLQWQAPFNNGSSTALDTFECHIQIGSGVEPFSQLVCDHPNGGTTGGNEFYWSLPMHFADGAVVQSGSLQVDNLTPGSSVCTDGSSNLTTSGCSGGGGGGIAVTPQTYGGKGDAATIGNGCTTNGTTTIVCPAGPFSSGDIGKLVCVQGAGAAGIGFCSAITAFTSNTTVVVTAAPPTNVTTAPAVFGHDDVVAIQDCFNYSGSNGVQCVLDPIGTFVNTAVGYLIYSAGLTIPTHSNITGNSYYGGTTIFSEYNGDAISLPTSTASLAAGQPISGVTFANIDIVHDPSWPNGRGIHLNSAAGIFGFGGMYYSRFVSVSDQNAALECLWSEGHTNSNDNPNQYLTFENFDCGGPSQSHPANEIKMTGIQAQILFMGGQINGQTGYYSNPLIYIGEETSGQSDSPVDVKFYGFTYEVGTQGLSIGEGTSNIHYDNGYIEQIGTPLIVTAGSGGAHSITFSGNHIANSGNVTAVADFIGGSANISATLHDDYVYGSTSPAAFAVCSGGTNNFAIDFQAPDSSISSTSDCATNHAGTGAALFQPFGTTATVDPSATVITTIQDTDVGAGKTLTLYALSGGGGSFSLGTGGTQSGNAYPINLGANTSPLVVTAGNSVILALLDQGSFEWTVVGGTAVGGVGLADTTVAVTGATQGSNSCSSPTTQTVSGLTTSNIAIPGYSSNPTSLTGWGSTGGMVFQAWPSAASTMSWQVCNQTSSSITYSSVTFNVGFK
jgi:hypothetical protein